MDKPNAYYYDIESIQNAFTLCVWCPNTSKGSSLHVYYSTDGIAGVSDINEHIDPKAKHKIRTPEFKEMGRLVANEIRAKNANFKGRIHFHNLGAKDDTERELAHKSLVSIFGVSDVGSDAAEQRRQALSQAYKKKHNGEAVPVTDPQDPVIEAKNVNDPRAVSSFGPDMRPVCDTDVDGEYINQAGEKIKTKKFNQNTMPYLMGFNSQNYDTTMLALYFNEAGLPNAESLENPITWRAVPPARMRKYNDALFRDDMRDRMYSASSMEWDDSTSSFQRAYGKTPRHGTIRRAMLQTGRYIDVARLVETQYKQGLKRLLGFKGLQILESDKLGNDSTLRDLNDFAELIAYNVSDVVNLEELFLDPAFIAQFENKRALMNQYPDVVYDEKGYWEHHQDVEGQEWVTWHGEYVPNISPYHVRSGGIDSCNGEADRKNIRKIGPRLAPDSKSAQFATKILCPWGHLTDIPAVSFEYPSKDVAEETGIKRRDILDECLKFVIKNAGEDSELYKDFRKVYDYYDNIRGRNFNDSEENYKEPHRKSGKALPLSTLVEVGKGDTCILYRRADGSPTSCYVNFSTGGIHGAEYNKKAFEKAQANWQKEKDLIEKAKALFEDELQNNPKYAECQSPAEACRRARTFEIDGEEHSYKEVLKNGLKIVLSQWKDIDAAKPQLFKKAKNGSTQLDPKWTYTSADNANHEDFSSYYPNLLRHMNAFKNPRLAEKGEDRYRTIYEQKQTYGKYEKDQSLTPEERNRYHLIRNGTKLILNAASGAADTSKYASPIQLNNYIISMRIIGQLFSWRIGQAQAFQGADVVSTNTDGLYTIMEETLNNQILAQEAKNINIQIDPEPMFFISKDSNNRLEMDAKTKRIFIANGGTLAHYKGVNMAKSLSHAAILDWLMAQYLIAVTDPNKAPDAPSIEDGFDFSLGHALLEKAAQEMDTTELLSMYATIVASNPSSQTYVFGTEEEDYTKGEPKILQHYNRAFFLKEPMEIAGNKTMHLHAAHPRVVTPAVLKRRERDEPGGAPEHHDATARKVLEANGIDKPRIQQLSQEKGKVLEAQVHQIAGIDESLNILIENHSIRELSDEVAQVILENLDLDAYLRRAAETYEKNWRNVS